MGQTLERKKNAMTESVFRELAECISQRKTHHEEGSYTCYLFEKGRDKILKKIG